MNQYYKSHRRPPLDYLFAYFHVVAKWLSPIAPLANLFMKMKWSKKLISKIFGIAEQRQLPMFGKSKKINKYASNQIGKATIETIQTSKTVLFLSDVFSEYIEPEVKQSAIEILNHFGYEVKQLSLVGAGASFLSKGFIDQAKRHAEKVLDEIKKLGAETTISVVGCEPPEVYCLKDEYFALLPHRKAEIESLDVCMVDEFILRVAKSEGLDNLDRQTDKEKIFFHPHCHHRASSSGTVATVNLLQLFGYKVELSDAGCCGMAGTFGFDAEHYELSMKIGELKLLPKIKQLTIDNCQLPIASSGAACRMQIRDGVGVMAKHPLVLVRDAISMI